MSCCGKSNHGREFDPTCEGPQARDIDAFGDDGITCPSCGSDVYHDAAMCNTCGHAMVKEPTSPRATWVRVTAAVVVVAFVLVFVL